MFVAGSDTILSYALKRASSDTTFELPPLGLSKILFLILEIGVLLYYYIQIKVKQIDASVLKRHIGLINSIIILNLFILINIHQLELSNRLFTYSAVLSVFPLCYLVQKYRLKENVITLFFVIMQLLLVLYFMNSIYIYEIPFGILINPFHLLFRTYWTQNNHPNQQKGPILLLLFLKLNFYKLQHLHYFSFHTNGIYT